MTTHTLMSTLAEDYLINYATKQKKSWRYDLSTIKGPLAPLMSKPVVEITRDVVLAWFALRSMTAPVWANRSLTTLKTMLRWGRKHGYPVNERAYRRLPHNPETPRIRFFTREERTSILDALRADDTQTSRYLLFLFHTGMSREAAKLTLAEVETMDLNSEARAIIERQRESNLGGIYLFEAERDTAQPCLSNPMGCVRRIRKVTGIRDFQPRDLTNGLPSTQSRAAGW